MATRGYNSPKNLAQQLKMLQQERDGLMLANHQLKAELRKLQEVLKEYQEIINKNELVPKEQPKPERKPFWERD